MSAIVITPPFELFTDVDGRPLKNGFVYVGIDGLEPISNPKEVYWDEDLTIPAEQPLRTMNGYVVNNGTAAEIFTDGDYSITVNNKNGTLVFSRLSDGPSGMLDNTLIADLSQSYTFPTVSAMKASAIIFPDGKKIFWQGYHTQSDKGSNWGIVKTGPHVDDGGSIFTLADGRYVEANLKGNRVNVLKFGAFTDGVTDSIGALDAATTFANQSQMIWLPDTGMDYKISRSWRLDNAYQVDGANITISPLAGFVGITFNDTRAGDIPIDIDYLMIFVKGNNVNDVGGGLVRKAFVGEGINLDCLNIAKGGLFLERMPYSNWGPNVYNCLGGADYGIYHGVFSWACKINNPNIESWNGGAIWIDDGCNGIEISTPAIWGNATTPPVGIVVNQNCNGIVINGGFIEKMDTAFKALERVGAVEFNGVDIEGVSKISSEQNKQLGLSTKHV